MTQGISGYRSSNYAAWQQAQEQETTVNRAAREYCTNADSVIAGALCGEDDVVSDACRAGRSDIDRTLCDDKELQAVQSTVWQATKDTLKTLFGALVGKAAK